MILPPKDGPLWYICFPIALILLFISEIYEAMSIKLRFFLASMTLILATVSFFHIDSYIADKHNINTVFWIAGIALGLWGLYQFWTISKDAGSGPEN